MNKVSISRRELAPEVLRLALMFGVVNLHAATGDAGVGRHVLLAKFMWPAVPCFLFISGYYGIRFSLRKVIAIYGVALLYSVANATALVYFSASHGGFFMAAVDCLKSYWFIHCYTFLMCCAPMVNLAMECKPKITTLLPFFFLCFGWGFMRTLPYIGNYLPDAFGLGPFGGLTFVGIYTFARWVRSLDEQAVPMYVFWIGIPVLWALVVLGFNDYNSPFTVVLSGLLFLVVRKWGRLRKSGSFFNVITPSILPVYLIHQTPAARECMRNLGLYINEHISFGLCTCVFVSVITFACCLAIDGIRRIVQFVIGEFAKKIMHIDK